MDKLVLLDPTPRDIAGFAAPLRRRIYGQIVDLARDAAEEPADRARQRVAVSAFDDIQISFAHLPTCLVILEVALAVVSAASTARIVRKKLEEKVRVLDHMDMAGLGMQIRNLPREAARGIKVLNDATLLYCKASPRSSESVSANLAAPADILSLIRRLSELPVKTWVSSDARNNFKDLLDGAERDPQAIERGSSRFLIVEESRLPQIIGRKNAAQMYKHFFEDSAPVEPFERIPGQAPGRLLDVG